MAQFQKGQTGNPRGRPRKDTKAMVINNDGWGNVLTGLRNRQDPGTNTTMQREDFIREQEASDIFVSDGLGRKIVEMPAEEALRPWLIVTADEGEAVCDRMEELGVQKQITEAYVWARLFGGAAIVTLVQDGGMLDQPLNEKSIQKIIGFRVYDRWRVQWTDQTINQRPEDPRFGLPEYYLITPVSGGQFRVHHSRIMLIDGRRLPETEKQRNNHWGASALQGIRSEIQRVASSHGYANGIIRDFVQAVLSVKGLSDMFAAGQEDVIKKRVQLLDLSRSIMNMMILDADGEKYTKTASSVAGLAELVTKFEGMLASVTGIPVTKLFGTSPGGLNATGESDSRNYYDALDADRKDKISPIMERIVRLIFLSKDGPTRGIEPEAWSIKWNSLYQLSDTQEAALRKTVAETDNLYLTNGVLDADDVRESRFGSGEWSMHTALINPNGPAGDV